MSSMKAYGVVFLFLLAAIVCKAPAMGLGQDQASARTAARDGWARLDTRLHLILPTRREVDEGKIPAALVRSSGLVQSEQVREFENKIPKHLPIQIRIKPDTLKAATDLNNDRWHHDLAFEVKNIGDKPIYYLSLFLDMPEIKPSGVVNGWPLSYGRSSIFGNGSGLAQPEDVPIKPNETIVLTLGQAHADGWDKSREIENLPQPTKLEIVFQELNFGDGTGFVGGTGTPWPRPKRFGSVGSGRWTVGGGQWAGD